MSLVPVDRYTPAETQPDWVALMQPAADLASQIAGTDFVPEAYRRNPAAIAACILFGAEIGIGPMQSLAKIDLVKGRPAPRAELARAKALAAGHELWVEESTNTRVTVSGKRRGSTHIQTVTWTLDDVKRAGISNGNYQKYPRQMLLARASAELVRQMCPEVLGGITVFAEEAADIDERDTPAVTAPAAVSDSPPGTRKRSRATRNTDQGQPAVEGNLAAKEADSASDETTTSSVARTTGRTQSSPQSTPPSEDAAATDGPSEAQTRMAMALFANLDAPDRDERLAKTSAILHREIDSWNGVTHDEASRVIDGLQRVVAGESSFVDSDTGWTIVVNSDELLDGGDDAA